ncbi:CNNM domain-containing protein, partial [Thermomonas sp.]
MSPDPGLTSAAILALLVLSGFAAALRAALWNASRTRLGELQKRGIQGAARTLALLSDEDRTMGALALA